VHFASVIEENIYIVIDHASRKLSANKFHLTEHACTLLCLCIVQGPETVSAMMVSVCMDGCGFCIHVSDCLFCWLIVAHGLLHWMLSIKRVLLIIRVQLPISPGHLLIAYSR
jgi:hypothetical protein